MDHTSFNQIIIDILVIFMVLGAFDKITHGKFNLGLMESFEEGFHALGPLALSMLGILSLAPVLTVIISKVIGPVYRAIGADPAMFAGALLSSDMGAYPIAMEMTADHDVACFSGIILGSVLGIVIVFTIPIALGIIDKADQKYLAQGVLYGIITVPIGCILGGIAAGYSISMIIHNTVPTIIIAVFFAVGIKVMPEKMIKGFDILGKIIVSVITIGLMAAIIEALTGIVLIKGMAPISEGYTVIGNIAIVLAGAFPMVSVITRTLDKPLTKAGRFIGINASSAAGMIASLANVIPMFGMMKNMDSRGKIINSAFAVSGSLILGDHLAFTASVEKDLIVPMIIAKAAAGIMAVLLAWIATRNKTKDC